MVKNQNIQEKSEDEKSAEVSLNEKILESKEAAGEVLETKEATDEKLLHQEARLKIEKMDVDDSLKLQAQSRASDLQSLDDQQKLQQLLKITKEKGVVFAVNVAKKMKDSYLLDTFHDMLAKEGYYKEFIK